MDAKKSDVGEAHERGKKTKIVGAFVIAGLIAMAVFVGTAAANGEAEIYGSRSFGIYEYQQDFKTTDDLYGFGDFGGYSDTHGPPVTIMILFFPRLIMFMAGGTSVMNRSLILLYVVQRVVVEGSIS